MWSKKRWSVLSNNKENMFRSSSGRTIESVPDVKRHSPRRIRWIAVLWICQAFPAVHAASFDRATFNRITFGSGCLQKQWMLTPDNALELLVTPTRDSPCEATLEFYFPQDIAGAPILAFEARSL